MPAGTTVRVQMLDDSVNDYDVKPSSNGSVLLHAIMKDLDILESDYFGASFDDGDGLTFVDPLRQIGRQVKKLSNTVLSFGVKFFTPDPSQMQDEYTRYLFALQIKRDISNGTLICAEKTAMEIASYIVQAEFGDWNTAECTSPAYLNNTKIFPDPNPQQLQKISELHRNLIGKKPDEADYSLLDIARRLELYGVRLYHALDAQNASLDLGVSHDGVLVFRDKKKINNFNWSRIRKLSFKRKRFLIKLRTDPVQSGGQKSIVNILIFVMNSRDACKNFWRLCIEHHAFFRLEVQPKPKPKPAVFSRGSSFHYNGKTQKELLELVRNSNFRRTNFVRTTSRRRTTQNTTPSSDIVTRKERQELNLQDMTLNQSNNVTPSGSVTSPSAHSTYTEEGSYRVNDSTTRSPDTEASITTVDITPDSSQKSPIPEWQLESKSLHSSATPIEGAETKQDHVEAKGNAAADFRASMLENNQRVNNGSCNFDETDYASNNEIPQNNNLSYGERMRIAYKNSHKNDSDVTSVETLLKNVTSNDGHRQRQLNTNISNNNTGFFAGSKSLSFDPLNSGTGDEFAPPLPPKERQLSNDGEGSYDNLHDMVNDESQDAKPSGSEQHVSSSGFKGMVDSKGDPFVNDSVVNLAAIDVPMTPEVKVRIGKQKIKTGHYAVPKQPPTPPDGESFNLPRWNRTSQILDKEMNEAMTQLYQAISYSAGNTEKSKKNKLVCVDVNAVIVVSSSDDEDGYDMHSDSEPHTPLSPEDDPLLATIEMKFDDVDTVNV